MWPIEKNMKICISSNSKNQSLQCFWTFCIFMQAKRFYLDNLPE
jgi:hypothetical protein